MILRSFSFLFCLSLPILFGSSLALILTEALPASGDVIHLRHNSSHSTLPTTTFIYPTYCAKAPLDPSTRQIPPLDPEDREHLELLQLHLITRHGTRTPSSFTNCWRGYDPHWNCSYDEAVLGLHSHSAEQYSNQIGSTYTFRKVYDANPESNVFGGTCQKGQLISEGALQNQEIGQFLAKSYFISNSDHKIPEPGSPPLISIDDDWSQSIYVRSTDMQRTRLSVSNLLTSLLESSFPSNGSGVISRPLPTLHTMDLEQDDLAINPSRCPRLNEIADEIFESAEFKQMEEKHLDLMKRLEAATGRPMPNGIWPDRMMDCLMSHLCANRWENLPDALNPNGENPSAAIDLIQETIQTIDEEMASLFLFLNSQYSRLGMARFFRDLRRIISDLVGYHCHSTLSSNSASTVPPKLYIWSGHDTTVLPFLASFGPTVWDSKWPPYASLIALEFFKYGSSTYMFRLIYNGNVLTGGVEGCNGRKLCEVTQFIQATDWVNDAIHECYKSRDPTESKLFFQPMRPNWPNPHPHLSLSMLLTNRLYLSIASLLIGVLTGAFVFSLILKHVKSRRVQNESLSVPLLFPNGA